MLLHSLELLVKFWNLPPPLDTFAKHDNRYRPKCMQHCFLDSVINVRNWLPSLRACRQARKLHVSGGSGLTSEALG